MLELQSRAVAALDFAQNQVRALITNHPDYFPLFTENGKWKHGKESWTNWCEGFLPGVMWIFARRTGDPFWRERAEHYSRLIEHRKHDRTVHDLGFLFWSTWKRWFDLEGDPRMNEVVITAGQTMGLRFNERGKYLRSFVAPESTFIDIMMNVGIIFYAANETGDADLLRRAIEHCLTTRRYLVRGDGSTAHEGIFDLRDGAFLLQSTHQGWREDSSWARGQTWALYGFGTAYHLSGDERFLDTAHRCADFFIARTPSHGAPPNDWEEPTPLRPYESSAAAIAASGLLQLAHLTKERERAAGYAAYARTILATLLSLPGDRHTRLGRHPQTRQLPRTQTPRRRRIGDVGRLLLRRGARQAARSFSIGVKSHLAHQVALQYPSICLLKVFLSRFPTGLC